MLKMKNKKSKAYSNIINSNIQSTSINEHVLVVTEFIPTAETYALGFFYDIGSRDETTEESGIAHFIEHLSFRRTNRYSSRQIASKFESLGAYANAYTTQESTSFYVRALKDNFLPILKLLNDITRNTIFDARDIEKERQIILEEIKSYDDDPEESIFDYGDKLIFGNHSMGTSILGTEDTLENIDSSKLENFHNKYYKNGKLIISYAGPHNHDYIVRKTSLFLVPPSDKLNAPTRIAPEIVAPDVQIIEKSINQAHLLLGARIPEYSFDSRFLLPLFNILFGDGMSSRLYQNLRDRHGIAYSIYSTIQVHSDCGVFYIYAATDKNKINKTEKLIIDEIDKFLNNPLRESELQRAKQQLKTSMIMELESLSARMQSLAKSIMMKDKFENIHETIEIIDNLKAEEIKEVVDTYISPQKLSKVFLMPKKS